MDPMNTNLPPTNQSLPPATSSPQVPTDTSASSAAPTAPPAPSATPPANASAEGKDPQILMYVTGLAFTKMGASASTEEVQKEIDTLYEKFQNEVYDLAYNQLTPEKQQELNAIVDRAGSQTEIQQFVLQNIPGFQQQLEDYVRKFQEEYTGEKLSTPETPATEPVASAATPERKETVEAAKVAPGATTPAPEATEPAPVSEPPEDIFGGSSEQSTQTESTVTPAAPATAPEPASPTPVGSEPAAASTGSLGSEPEDNAPKPTDSQAI
jgi:hypothetical protein